MIIVLLPAFNEEKSFPPLMDKLSSTLSQTKEEYKFIVCNDGSSDGTSEILIFTGLEESIFYSSRLVVPEFTSLLGSPHLSIICGIFTLLGELSFIGILFYSSLRVPCILLMIVMHMTVYYSAGINFIGSSVLLILCLDWNS